MAHWTVITSTSQTDGWTDRQTTHCRKTALCVASRGKNTSDSWGEVTNCNGESCPTLSLF